MKNFRIPLLFLSLFFISCASPQSSQPALSNQEVLNTAVASVVLTQTAEAPPVPTATTEPPTPLPTSTQHTDKEYAWNYLATQDSGGIVITIGRVVLAEKDYLSDDFKSWFQTMNIFSDRMVVGEIIFIVENTTQAIATAHPYFGKVLVENEQIDLMDFWSSGSSIAGDRYGGELLPGARLIGGLWFGLKRTDLQGINGMTIYISAPHDQNYNTLGQNYNFILDLSEKQFAPFPEELR